MRVCVYGAGAIGGHLAARLARGGAQVSLVARGAHLDAIRANGLRVEAHDGVHLSHPAASEDPRDLGRQDAVLVTVKAPALPSVAAGIAPLLGPETAVAFVMNGIPWWFFHGAAGPLAGTRLPEVDPEGAVERAVGIGRTIGGVVYSASEVVAPGVVRSEHGNIRVILGEPDGRVTPRAQALAEVIAAGGMPCPVTPDIRTEVWRKLLGNLSSGPLCVLSRQGVRATYADPALRAAARLLGEEGRAIAAALGCDPGAEAVERVANSNLLHKPSILQDLELGRPMEVAALFDLPLRLARLTGTPTPMLDLLVGLARKSAEAAGLYRV